MPNPNTNLRKREVLRNGVPTSFSFKSLNYLFAWFSVDKATAQVKADEDTFTVRGELATVGKVEFEAVIGTISGASSALDLSNNWGNTKYIAGGQTLDYTNAITDTYVVVPIKVIVKDVSGGDTFANKIQSMTGGSVAVNITGSLTNSSSVDCSSVLKYKVSGAPTRQADETQSATWATESVTGIKSALISGSETAGATVVAEFNLYVGLDGTNELAVNTIQSRTITITATPVYTPAA